MEEEDETGVDEDGELELSDGGWEVAEEETVIEVYCWRLGGGEKVRVAWTRGSGLGDDVEVL